MEDLVKVTCYGKTEVMKREDALLKYLECMACSEGSERSRYVDVYLDLITGKTICSDEV